MKFRSVSLLAFAAVDVQAFFVPSRSKSFAIQKDVAASRSLLVRSSMTAVSENKTWRDVQDFNMGLDKLAERAGSPNEHVISRAAECQELWETQLSEATDALRPDTISFNTVLKAWNKCCQSLTDRDRHVVAPPADLGRSVPIYTPRDAAERATTLLFQQESNINAARPDSTSYNIVIDTWAKSRVDDAPQAAERLLKRMLDSDGIEPDTLSYHGVLDAWAHSGKDESLVKVKQIFQHMQGLYDSGKDVKPTIRTMNSIVNAHAKRATYYSSQYENQDPEKAWKCATEAHQLLISFKQRYHDNGDPDDQPDVMTYTSVMDAFARCGNYKMTQQAELLLRELKGLYKKSNDPKLRPNFRTYTSLINAWSRTRSHESPGRVEFLLKEMGDDPVTRANTRTYTSVIQCWAKSRDGSKAKRALKILRDMKDNYKETGNEDIRPNVLTFNAAIDACARCQGTMEQQTEAIKIAFAILKATEVDDHVTPNNVTYSTLLRAVSYLLPAGAERNKVASAVFEKAKNAGLVDSTTVKNLRQAVDSEVMLTMFEGIADQNGSFDYNNVPAAWTKNVNNPY